MALDSKQMARVRYSPYQWHGAVDAAEDSKDCINVLDLLLLDVKQRCDLFNMLQCQDQVLVIRVLDRRVLDELTQQHFVTRDSLRTWQFPSVRGALCVLLTPRDVLKQRT